MKHKRFRTKQAKQDMIRLERLADELLERAKIRVKELKEGAPRTLDEMSYEEYKAKREE